MIKNKVVRILIYSIVLIFAMIGFFLSSAFLAIKLHWTNDPGAVDFNDRYFAQNSSRDERSSNDSSGTVQQGESGIFVRLCLLNQYYPENAALILESYSRHRSLALVNKMLEAAEVHFAENEKYQQQISQFTGLINQNKVRQADTNIYYWANTMEWKTFRQAVVKDTRLLDSVGKVCGVEPRLLATMLIGEQIRLFDSRREAFKKWVSPLKILVNETTLSLGVMGIKEETAIKIENYLKDPASPFYLGPEYEHLLDFKTNDVATERVKRLTNSRNHTYPYMYAAIFLRQVDVQWKRNGFDISTRPEILATLFNLGFEVSKPKADPRTGGSRINILGHEYTFGGLAYEFYYSGVLSAEFPYTAKPFTSL